VAFGLTGPARLTQLEPSAALQPLAIPSPFQLTCSHELLLVTCRLPAASWNAVAHRSRRSMIAADRPRRVVASGDACANGQARLWRSNDVFLLLWPSRVGPWAAGFLAQRISDGAFIHARRGGDCDWLETLAGVDWPSLDASFRVFVCAMQCLGADCRAP